MKTNTYLALTLISGPIALCLGAGIAVFGVLVAAAIFAMACNDYAETRPLRIRSAA